MSGWTGLPPTSGIDLCRTRFAGMTLDQLTAERNRIQIALGNMAIGGNLTEASYTQGDGARSVRYNQLTGAQILSLKADLELLNRFLGVGCPSRRPLRPFFT